MSLTTVQPGMLGTPQPYNFKNRVINGNMSISQRNGTASSTLTASAITYTVDRFGLYCTTGTGHTYQQVADAPSGSGFNYSMKFTVGTGASPSAASDQNEFYQWIEGYNVADLAWGTSSAKPLTISFWVKSSLTGTFPVGLQDNGAGTWSYITSYTYSAANTWQYVTVTIPGCTNQVPALTTNAGVSLWFSFGAGSSGTTTANSWNNVDAKAFTGQTNIIATSGATWQVTGVQVEVGVSATTFDTRPYTTELQLCQRYGYSLFNQSVSTSYIIASGQCFSSSSGRVTAAIPVTMRAIPSATITGAASNFQVYNAVNSGLPSLSSLALQPVCTTPNLAAFDFGGASGLTAGYATSLVCGSGGGGSIFLSAEL